ncbi:MAG: hypothetical protein ACXW2E_06800 [Nitrososphaeraceae archaeon]
MKAAEAAKDLVTKLEQQLNALKQAQAASPPFAAGVFQDPINQLQNALNAAKADAANKDAAAKSAM